MVIQTQNIFDEVAQGIQSALLKPTSRKKTATSGKKADILVANLASGVVNASHY